MNLPQRKPNRMKDFDYSRPNAFFITICIVDKRCILWERVGAAIGRPQEGLLSEYGRIVEAAIRNIPERYPCVEVDHYVIMPNHVHLLLQIHADLFGRAMPAPAISTVIQQMKGYVSKQAGFSVWQKSFHDHVIRNEWDYRRIWEYIDSNPAKWAEDCFYVE